MSDFLGIIKQAALDANQSTMPCAVMFGTVVSESPFQISVDQKMTLDADSLILTQSITTRSESMTFHDATQAAGARAHTHTVGDRASSADSAPNHFHAFSGDKTVQINGALRVGDCVVLLRMQGGQKFIVLDKVVAA